MANEIYSSSWWGFSSPTGFGNIYDQYNNIEDVLSDLFLTRVEADGGTVEAKSCLSALGLSQYNWEYNNRVEADGGTIESLECVIF